MEEIISAISTVGFPIAMTTYLMFRMEQKLDKLTDAIHGLNTQTQMLRNDVTNHIQKD